MEDYCWYEYAFPNFDKHTLYDVKIINTQTHETVFSEMLTSEEYVEAKSIFNSDKNAILNLQHKKLQPIAKLKIEQFRGKEIPDINKAYKDDNTFYLGN